MIEPRQDPPIDPQLSRLYREQASAEPADDIDQRILDAARQAVAPRAPGAPGARRAGWWQRWRMPLTLLTTVMLTVTLALLIDRQPRELSSAPGPESARERAEDTASSAAPATQLPAPAAAPTRKNAARPLAGSREADRAPANNSSADQAPAAPSPAAKAESAPSPAGAASEATARGEMRSAPAPSTADPAAARLEKSRADRARSPGAWLEEIRALRNAGRSEEAERQLREFRLAHPEYPLPEEFRQ